MDRGLRIGRVWSNDNLFVHVDEKVAPGKPGSRPMPIPRRRPPASELTGGLSFALDPVVKAFPTGQDPCLKLKRRSPRRANLPRRPKALCRDWDCSIPA